MSLFETYFAKQPDSLKYFDVENFFREERHETDKIEFKSYYNVNENYKEKENGVLRTICAFLNSGGGIIIWGAPVGKVVEGSNKDKVFAGELSPLDLKIDKDGFINRISDAITPTPSIINFYQLEKKNQFVYLIEVFESQYSPHQFKNTYYMRIDGQSRPAPHHYIEALFRKVSFPKLQGYLKLERLYNDGTNIFLDFTPLILNLSKLQNEHNLYYRIIVTKGTFVNYSAWRPGEYGMEGHEKRVVNAQEILYYNEVFRSVDTIIFKYDDFQKADGEFEIFIYFGGKSSPLLFSKYKLKIDFHNLSPKNLNSLIVNMEENTYSYEFNGNLNHSEEQRLQLLLGR